MSAARAPAGLRPTHYRLERLASLNRQALALVDVERLPELAPLELILVSESQVIEQLLYANRTAQS